MLTNVTQNKSTDFNSHIFGSTGQGGEVVPIFPLSEVSQVMFIIEPFKNNSVELPKHEEHKCSKKAKH